MRRSGKEPTNFNRIGNRRRLCDTCNNFAAAVRRGVAKRLAAEVSAERTEQIRREVEMSLYPGVIEQWSIKKELPR